MKNRESSTAIPHANVPKENELFTIRIIAKTGRCKALQTLRAALIFLFLQGFQNLVGLFLEFKYLQGQKKTLQEINFPNKKTTFAPWKKTTKYSGLEQ